MDAGWRRLVVLSHQSEELWQPRLKSIEELLFAVVGMLAVLDFGAGHTIALARPGAEVNHSASLGAERPEAVGRRYVDRAFANRTTHRAHPNRKLPDRRAARKSRSAAKSAYDAPGGSESHREEPPPISNIPESRM